MKCTECGSDMIRGQSGMVCGEGCGRIHPDIDPASIVRVISPGCGVRFAGGTEGVVTAAMIQAAGRISYQVAHWVNGRRETDWLDDFEVVPMDQSDKVSCIGFAVEGAA